MSYTTSAALTQASLIAITLAIFLTSSVNAAGKRVSDFPTARQTSSTAKRPLAVLVHGSSWHPASQRLLDGIWSKASFANQLEENLFLSHIHIQQHLNPESAKTTAAKHKAWTKKWNYIPTRTYPAIQIYSHDGHLLKSIHGQELRRITTPKRLAEKIDTYARHALTRQQLILSAQTARNAGDAKTELKHLTALAELPLRTDAKLAQMLKKADPNDTSGWQARLEFKNWDYIRHITKLISEKKTKEALVQTDGLLSGKKFTPQQRALLLGAKGRILLTDGDRPAAWKCFRLAHETDPDGPNGIAILRYGTRVVGLSLREAVPLNSPLHGKNIGINISRDHATFTASSAENDDGKHHTALFKGQPSTKGFAFHTQTEKGAHIIIDLHARREIRAIHIVNRRQTKRAANLTLWVSQDKKNWFQLWQAPNHALEWSILLSKPTETRYLKLGNPANIEEPLHLQAVNIFGK